MKNHKISFLDKDRSLRFDINAMSDAEDVLRDSIFAVLSDPRALLQFRVQRALWWAGLKHEDPALTLESTGNLLQKAMEAGSDMRTFASEINKALTATGLFRLNGKAEETADPKTPPQDNEE